MARGGGYNNELRLKKYKNNNCKIIVCIFLSLIVFMLTGVCLYKTYATFTEEKNFNVINGEVQDPGDIYFAYYVDDTITKEMPKRAKGYIFDVNKSYCTNGVIPSWDNDKWIFLADYNNYNAIDYTRTKCNLYFKSYYPIISEKITELASTDTINLVIDEAGNIRYYGADPNNYVSFDGDIWRIIGVMKSIDDGTGNKNDRVKIIRANSIGSYSWDTSELSVNSGYGVNEWSQADLMKLLNPGYESESVGGSLYWYSKYGTCYNGLNNITTACDFTNSGLKNYLKTLIGDALWHIGSNGTNNYQTSTKGLVSHFYTYERSNDGKICTSGDYCNDDLTRTTAWVGKVGLMYPSDYGYATSGGSTTNRNSCLAKEIYGWNDSSYTDCKNSDWLYNLSDSQWTISPWAYSLNANDVFFVDVNGRVFNGSARLAVAVRPSVYLLSDVKILSGDGSSSNPFILGL